MEELNDMDLTIICFLGYPMMLECVMPNGIGSMPEIIAENVVWIWSVQKLPMNMNGSREKWEVCL